MNRIQIAFIGDLMLGRGVNDQLRGGFPPESFWGDTLPILKSADLVIANLECAITDANTLWERTEKVFHFKADPGAIKILQAGNVGCVNLANNHILDFEEAGMIDTLHYLDSAGVKHVGAGMSLAQAKKPVLIDIKGTRIGIVGITDNEPSFAATDDKPGTNYVNLIDKEAVNHFVANLSNDLLGNADITICSIHWGPNMAEAPLPEHYEIADKLISHGVDIIQGHSAHNFQAVRKIQDSLTLFDTGDFIDDYAVDPYFRNDWSFIFIIEIEDAKLIKLRMIPVILDFAEVNLARGNEDFKLIRDRMKELCNDINSGVDYTDEGLEIKF